MGEVEQYYWTPLLKLAKIWKYFSNYSSGESISVSDNKTRFDSSESNLPEAGLGNVPFNRGLVWRGQNWLSDANTLSLYTLLGINN